MLKKKRRGGGISFITNEVPGHVSRWDFLPGQLVSENGQSRGNLRPVTGNRQGEPWSVPVIRSTDTDGLTSLQGGLGEAGATP